MIVKYLLMLMPGLGLAAVLFLFLRKAHPLLHLFMWVVLHRENNTPGLIIHFITNGSGVVSILLAVLGVT